jgi:hypothetical protein
VCDKLLHRLKEKEIKMLDITKVLNRSWHILWKYRMLWVFGFFLALAAGGGGSNSSFNWTQNADRGPGQWDWNPKSWGPVLGQSGDALVNLLITCGVILLVVILIWSVVTTFLKYISETAAIRGVNDYEDTGIKAGFKQLWKTGWSKTSWRLFLINLLLSLPFLVMLILLGLLGLWVYFAVTGGGEAFKIFSIITAVGLTLLLILFFVLLGIAISMVGIFAFRYCVLEGSGVIDSIKQGYAMIRRHLKQVFFMWLVMIGIGIAWFVAVILLLLPLFIAMLVMVLPAVLVGGIPGLITAGFAALFQMPSPWFWIVGGLVALPIFGLVFAAPSLLVGGWQQIFYSSVWTETYRELKALEVVKPAPAPQVKPSVPTPRKVAVKSVSSKPAPARTSIAKKAVKKTTAKPAAKPKTTPK